MTLQTPYALLHLIWLIPLLIGFAWYGAATRRRRLAAMIPDATQRQRLSTNASPYGRAWRLALVLLGVAFAMLAAARPTWGEALVDRPTPTRDVLVIFDVSRSMLARDVAPTRLQHARFLVGSLFDKLQGTRFGIVAFAGDAALLCPLTANQASLKLYLDQLDAGAISVGGTNLPKALEVADAAFESSGGEHRGVLLVTDGDNLGGDPADALKKLTDKGVKIYTVGLGDPQFGSFIQLPDTTFITDEAGNRVRSQLNEPMLQDLATQTGGRYVHSTAVNDGVDFLAAHLEALVPKDDGVEQRVVPIERYQWPLALAMLCLLARLLVGERRRDAPTPQGEAAGTPIAAPAKATAATLALLLGLGLLAGAPMLRAQGPPPKPTPMPPLIDPNAPTITAPPTGPLDLAAPVDPSAAPLDPIAQARQTALTALAEQESALKTGDGSPNQVRELFNLGRRYQALEDAEGARRCYEAVVTAPQAPTDAKVAALQNLGAARHLEALDKLGTYKPDEAMTTLNDARKWYAEAMRQAPGDKELARNQELLLQHRKQAQEMKELLEKQKQKQQDAQDKTEQARDDQQAANDAQQKASDQSQAKSEEEQQKQQQKADQQQQAAADQTAAAQQSLDEAQKAQQQAQQKAEQARKDAQQARQEQRDPQAGPSKAEQDQKQAEAKADQQQQAAKQAREEAQKRLEEAQQAQSQAAEAKAKEERAKAGEEAKEKLDDALAQLKPEDQDKQDGDQGDGQPDKDKDGDPDKPQDSQTADKGDDKQDDVKPSDQPGDQAKEAADQQAQDASAGTTPQPTEEELDKQAASRLLQSMEKSDKDFAQEMQKERAARSRQFPAKQDW